ncbi:MAG: type III polyketide synthase [Planctomycetota bacterium]|nr:type III polyketide synthase [Planctomycetota bacterium]
MTATLRAIGTCVPEHALTRAEAARLAGEISGADERRARMLRALADRTGIDRRGLTIADGTGGQSFYRAGRPPTTGERMEAYRGASLGMAEPACRDALRRAGVDASSVTHVVVASCTGFGAPGIDQALMRGLGIPRDARRTIVGFMGCHGAINALAVGAAFTHADPDAVVLVCAVEVCGLHFSFDDEPDHVLANTLFADGAAAAILTGRPAPGCPHICSTASVLIPDSHTLMRWDIGDHGFRMRLSPKVPDVLATHVPAWIDGVLRDRGLARADVGGWAIHPGGPRIVDVLRESLGLRDDQVEPSRKVLRSHGNMSSATVLFILRDLWARDAATPWVGMAFGPGLAGEAVVLGAPQKASAP